MIYTQAGKSKAIAGQKTKNKHKTKKVFLMKKSETSP